MDALHADRAGGLDVLGADVDEDAILRGEILALEQNLVDRRGGLDDAFRSPPLGLSFVRPVPQPPRAEVAYDQGPARTVNPRAVRSGTHGCTVRAVAHISTMTRKHALRLVLIMAALGGVAYWASPYVAAARLANAAKRGDIEAIVTRFDVPRMRISLARQIVRAWPLDQALVAAIDPAARQAAGLVAVTYVDAMISEHFSSEALASALAGQAAPFPARPSSFQALPRLAAYGISSAALVSPAPSLLRSTSMPATARMLAWASASSAGTWRVVSLGLPREVVAEAIRLLKNRTG